MGVLVFDTLPGLVIGIVLSLFLLLGRASRPHVAVLVRNSHGICARPCVVWPPTPRPGRGPRRRDRAVRRCRGSRDARDPAPRPGTGRRAPRPARDVGQVRDVLRAPSGRTSCPRRIRTSTPRWPRPSRTRVAPGGLPSPQARRRRALSGDGPLRARHRGAALRSG
ncbi:hypothetical protein NKG05_28485 [Oerskovia sp. M15]